MIPIPTNETTWDAIAESFDTTRHTPWKPTLEFIQTIPQTAIVADIGCGNGRNLIPCANICNQVIGIDISKKLLIITKKKTNQLHNVSLLHSDITALPLKNNSIDVVLCIAALHNIRGKTQRIHALHEIERILKKDGHALITVWSRWQDMYRSYFLKKLIKRQPMTEFGDIDIPWHHYNLNIPRFYHLYSKKEFISDIKQTHLHIEAVKSIKIAARRHPDNFFAYVQK
jgi:ubiquinone/menaquinone biosynthesis C-methylase UbiE